MTSLWVWTHFAEIAREFHTFHTGSMAVYTFSNRQILHTFYS